MSMCMSLGMGMLAVPFIAIAIYLWCELTLLETVISAFGAFAVFMWFRVAVLLVSNA